MVFFYNYLFDIFSFGRQLIMILYLYRDSSRQPKITQLYLAVFINEDISWFNIPMHDSRLVYQVNGTENVVNDGDNMLFSELHFVRHV